MPKNGFGEARFLLGVVEMALDYAVKEDKSLLLQFFIEDGEVVDQFIIENEDKYQEAVDYMEESQRKISEETSTS